ncbi:MAG: MobA/MobL family protein, partial [Oscillospiraceae bacterium]|nr:MobA/MobL family protein [Oscillospiraceae bacterium]
KGKIIVIRPEVLRREYRQSTHQLKLCTGGFGASPHSRGSAVYCTDLYSGENSRYERRDVLGTLAPEQLPEWARHGLASIEQAEKRRKAELAKEGR